MKSPKKEKPVTIAECDAAYKATREMYQRFISHAVETKLGGPTKAAARIMRSRTHLSDCMNGHRRLDTVRSLAWAIAGEALGEYTAFGPDDTL